MTPRITVFSRPHSWIAPVGGQFVVRLLIALRGLSEPSFPVIKASFRAALLIAEPSDAQSTVRLVINPRLPNLADAWVGSSRHRDFSE